MCSISNSFSFGTADNFFCKSKSGVSAASSGSFFVKLSLVAASFNFFRSIKPRLADSGNRPPFQEGTMLLFEVLFLTCTVMSFIMINSRFLPASVKESPGLRRAIKYSSIMPTYPPVMNFTLSIASLTIVPICMRWRIAILRLLILYNPSSIISTFLKSSYCCNAMPPTVINCKICCHSSLFISLKQ